VLSLLRQKQWSPYLAGVLLGLVYIVSIWVAGTIPGASGAFENLGGLVAKVVAPALANNTYFRFVMPPGITWEVIMMAGVIAGSFVAAVLSGSFKLRLVSDAQWGRVFGQAIWKRWLAAFLGGIIIEFGAGVAGGCTSGLAVGGGLFLAPAAFIFMIGMFMSGIPVAMIMYRRRY